MAPSRPERSRSRGGLRDRVTIVIATRNRRAELDRTLTEIRRSYPEVPTIVVDNASRDGTAPELRRTWPDVEVLALGHNAGAAARNRGVARARTPYIAFCDDDSWWEPGALEHAAALFDSHPPLALVAGRTLVGAARQPDPVNQAMEEGGLVDGHAVPGVPILGFTACSAVVRRRAYLDAGGFSDLLFFVGEEKLLAQDLAALGWALRYVDEVAARHHPSKQRPPSLWRRGLERRNTVLIAWLRRPVPVAIRETRALVLTAARDRAARRALLPALCRIPHALLRRRRLPDTVESNVASLEHTGTT